MDLVDFMNNMHNGIKMPVKYLHCSIMTIILYDFKELKVNFNIKAISKYFNIIKGNMKLYISAQDHARKKNSAVVFIFNLSTKN